MKISDRLTFWLAILWGALIVDFPTPARACLNEYQPRTPGIRTPNLERIIHSGEDRSTEEQPRDLGPLAYSEKIEERNDYAVGLIRAGKLDEAIDNLLAIEQERPGDYATATNLGTAYELSGNDDEAIKWIMQGIRRNPESHQGTEWLHVDILATKILRSKQPDAAGARRVLPATFDGTKDVVDSRGVGHTLYGVQLALEVQLGERLAFVAPPDELVGGMLADLGLLLAKDREYANQTATILQMALDYGAPEPDAVQARLARTQWTIIANGLLARMRMLLLFAVGTCVVICLLGVRLFYARLKRRRTLIAATNGAAIMGDGSPPHSRSPGNFHQ